MCNNSSVVMRRKPFQELTFTDDFMFRQVLIGDPDLCRRLIELLLDVEIDYIVYKDDEAIGFESTITAFPGSDNDTHKEYIVAAQG